MAWGGLLFEAGRAAQALAVLERRDDAQQHPEPVAARYVLQHWRARCRE